MSDGRAARASTRADGFAAVVFVDTNVFVYAVGAEHPHRSDAREFFRRSVREGLPLVTSAEVLQELLHVLLHLACCRRRDVTRVRTFDRGLASAFG